MIYARINLNETEFWNKDDGWGTFDNATLFTPEEREDYTLPHHSAAEPDWLLMQECRKQAIHEKLHRGEYPDEVNKFGGIIERTFMPWRDFFDNSVQSRAVWTPFARRVAKTRQVGWPHLRQLVLGSHRRISRMPGRGNPSKVGWIPSRASQVALISVCNQRKIFSASSSSLSALMAI